MEARILQVIQSFTLGSLSNMLASPHKMLGTIPSVSQLCSTLCTFPAPCHLLPVSSDSSHPHTPLPATQAGFLMTFVQSRIYLQPQLPYISVHKWFAQLCFSFAACSFHDIYELASPWLYNFEVRLRASGVLVYLVTLACHDSNQALRVLLLTTPQLPNHGHGIH